MAKLFLSHSSKDNADAVAISVWLRANGWDDIFLDFDPQRGIKGGDRWEQALNDAASRCEAVVFLVSRAWLASDWCLKEFGLAAKLNKRLLGVLIEDLSVTDLPVFLTDTWQMIDLARGLRREEFTIALPVTGESAEVSFSSEGLVRLREGLRKAGLDPNFFAWPPANDPGRSPYPGLRPLEADDAGVFFGREVQIIEALDRLRAVRDGSVAPLLCVLGASGSGKSSFLRAGILPRLNRDDRMFLPLPVLRPGRAAISGGTGLASVLVSAFASAGLALARSDAEAAIRKGAAGLRPLFDRLVETAASSCDDGGATPPLLVLSIDQAEELFLADGADESAALLEIVADLASQARHRLAILLTIRSESFERLQTAPQWEGVALATLTFSPMPKGLYATLIERPAARLADTDRPLAVEPALVRALLDDMADGGGRDALPLLAFTLERIWLEFGASGRLTLQNYEALGRVRGSIEAAVERAIAAADADPRIPEDRSARLMLLRRGLVPWLAGIDPDTGSPRRRVARRAEIPDEALPLIDLLIEQRLLSSDADPVTGETVIEPAHEALLRQWGLLDGWLVDDFALLAALEGVKRATREWEANAREPAWLAHQGGRLADAQGLDARADIATMLDAADRAYLSACLAQETAEHEALEQRRLEREAEQARRLVDARKIVRRTGVGLVVAIVLAVAAGGFGFVAKLQKSRADEKTVEAEAQRDAAARAEAIAKQQMAFADASRKETEKRSGLLAASVAQTYTGDGDLDAASLLLMQASKPFDNPTMPDRLGIAFSQLLDRRQRQLNLDIPPQSILIETDEALFIKNDKSGALFVYGDTGLQTLIEGGRVVSPIVAARLLTDGSYLILRKDGSVETLCVSCRVPHTAHKFKTVIDEDALKTASVSLTITSDGLIAYARLTKEVDAFSNNDGNDQSTIEIFNSKSGVSGEIVIESRVPEISHFKNQLILHDRENFFVVKESAKTFNAARIKVADSKKNDVSIAECLDVMPKGARAAVRSHAIEIVGIDTSHRIKCRGYGPLGLVTSFGWTSAGLERKDRLFDALGRSTDVSELLGLDASSNVSSISIDQKSGQIAAAQSREISVLAKVNDSKGSAISDYPKEARAAMHFKSRTASEGIIYVAGGRLAVVEAQAGRITVFNTQSASTDVHISAAGQEKAPPPPERIGGCASGYYSSAGYHFGARSNPDGYRIELNKFQEGTEEVPQLKITNKAGKVLKLEKLSIDCIAFSDDFQTIVTTLNGQLTIHTKYLESEGLGLGVSFAFGSKPITSVSFLADAQAFITSNESESLLQWRLDPATRRWQQSVIYRGDAPITHSEISRDGKRLIVIEHSGLDGVHSILYSLEAHQKWYDFGTEFRYLNTYFTSEGGIAVTYNDLLTDIYKLLPLDRLVALVDASLPNKCRVSQGRPVSSSPCWPSKD